MLVHFKADGSEAGKLVPLVWRPKQFLCQPEPAGSVSSVVYARIHKYQLVSDHFTVSKLTESDPIVWCKEHLQIANVLNRENLAIEY